jgi:hypothetical protein
VTAPGADHFLNDGPTEALIEALETCIPAPPRPLFNLSWPRLTAPLAATGGLHAS